MEPLFGRKITAALVAGTLYLSLAHPVYSQELEDVLAMNLQQLMQMDVVVTSVSKRPQKLHKTASAVFVVTQDDIRRTGAVNIMEALRIVPGVLVSKINQNRYAISIRGFNRRFSDKLLVLLDGRSVYNPSDSGVVWLALDTVLEDVDRIEVIRGPGASLWGSNAVAGVINIITKGAHETQGAMLSGGTGTEEKGFVTGRYGGKIGDKFAYRVYGKYRNRDEGKNADGSDSFDGKQMGQGGFRSDWQVSSQKSLTMQGDYFNLDAEQDWVSTFKSIDEGSVPFRGGNIVRGGNFLSRWTHELEDASSYMFQVYYDRFERKSLLPRDNSHDKVDVEFQHNFKWGDRQQLSWGLNYRYTHFEFAETSVVLAPLNEDTHLYSFFLHDEIEIVPNRWSVILGSKFEHNDFSGFEYQPNIRTVWTPNENNTLWAAVSRAVRIPSVTEEKNFLNRIVVPLVPSPTPCGALCLLIREKNDGRTDAEELLAYEVGYRHKIPSRNLSIDIAGYYFDYDNLITSINLGNPAPDPSFPPNVLVQDTLNDNVLEGEIYGVELAVEWEPLRYWRVAASYGYMQADIRNKLSVPVNFSEDFAVNGEPEHVFSVRSYLSLPHDLEFDSMLYYVSRSFLAQSVLFPQDVKSYTRLDLRLGWKPRKDFELSLVGQNLLDDQHAEHNGFLEFDSETERSFYAKATFRF